MNEKDKEAIRFEDVNYSLEHEHILKGVTGSFVEGEITTVVGPSGAGKTTLFRLCNGLKTPESGQISILGKDIADYEPVELRRTVGIALQQAPMVSGSVRENLELPMKLKGKALADKDAEELLGDVGLGDVSLERDSKDLSGGQRQKLSIARTLVNRPKILLLDEITSSLDPASQREIEQLIVKLNEKFQTTIVWITHNLEQALRIGRYTWVMMDGQLMESGKSELLHHPTNDRVRRFVEGGVA